jgi:DNA-binding transcriptional regulator YiaG
MPTAELPDAELDVAALAEVRQFCASGRARGIRERACLTLGEVGRSVGVAPSTVARWEDGTRRPTGRAAERYLRLLRRIDHRPAR